ncbi:hypothetical protein R3P38DRAFT_3293210 [Favolaschia claudopus]|uniref:Uncharacterized protein n=1 Tax=Favolaschia claudopus TaxID=2862362 RepID=A0AAV9ZI70_9AGAR
MGESWKLMYLLANPALTTQQYTEVETLSQQRSRLERPVATSRSAFDREHFRGKGDDSKGRCGLTMGGKGKVGGVENRTWQSRGEDLVMTGIAFLQWAAEQIRMKYQDRRMMYSKQRSTDILRLDYLVKDFNYKIGLTTLKDLNRRFNVETVKKPPPEHSDYISPLCSLVRYVAALHRPQSFVVVCRSSRTPAGPSSFQDTGGISPDQ